MEAGAPWAPCTSADFCSWPCTVVQHVPDWPSPTAMAQVSALLPHRWRPQAVLPSSSLLWPSSPLHRGLRHRALKPSSSPLTDPGLEIQTIHSNTTFIRNHLCLPSCLPCSVWPSSPSSPTHSLSLSLAPSFGPVLVSDFFPQGWASGRGGGGNDLPRESSALCVGTCKRLLEWGPSALR